MEGMTAEVMRGGQAQVIALLRSKRLRLGDQITEKAIAILRREWSRDAGGEAVAPARPATGGLAEREVAFPGGGRLGLSFGPTADGPPMITALRCTRCICPQYPTARRPPLPAAQGRRTRG
jgi:hypothetical protein